MTSPPSPTAASPTASGPAASDSAASGSATGGEETDSLSEGTVVSDSANGKSRRRKPSTSHLKQVPQPRALREELRELCRETAAKLDKAHPLDKQEMERVARRLLANAGQPEGFLGWAMVVLASEFWRDQVAATPPERRLLLLPPCPQHAEGIPADGDESGLDSQACGTCSLADYRTTAEEMGYKVLVAEGSPKVMNIIVGGSIDAIVGVASLNVLEQAIDKVLLAGIPCMAAPLLASDCCDTSVDEEWVSEFINARQETSAESTRSYLHLLRGAKQMFDADDLERLLPRRHNKRDDPSKDSSSDPIGATEQIAYDFLARGGKYARPFITLAAFDAASGGHCTQGDGGEKTIAIPDSARRVALSIEAFHKASLVHDDIQDDDAYRYGAPTIHKEHGVAMAINVGDYLIGLGYQMVARDAADIGPDAVADILLQLSEAHTRLCEGQGAELLWRDGPNKRLTPIDALRIYALKTSPAFQAALYGGVRLAGDAAHLAKPIHEFSKHLGIAFQILNDLKDWQGDDDNKLEIGGDVLGGRPTLLLALALESLDEEDAAELLDLAGAGEANSVSAISPADAIGQFRRLYEKANVFETADRLVDEHQDRAEQVADDLPTEELRRLAYYLIDTVLERHEGPTSQSVPMAKLDMVANPKM